MARKSAYATHTEGRNIRSHRRNGQRGQAFWTLLEVATRHLRTDTCCIPPFFVSTGFVRRGRVDDGWMVGVGFIHEA